MLYEALRDEYVRIAEKALAGGYIDADLEALTHEILATVKALNLPDWKGEVRKLRSEVQALGERQAGSAPDALAKLDPDKGRRLHVFIAGAVVRLDELLDPTP